MWPKIEIGLCIDDNDSPYIIIASLCVSMQDNEKLFELRESLDRSEQMTHEMV